MRRVSLLGMALLAAMPLPAVAESADVPETAVAPASEAMALARLMSPRDLLIGMELREFDKNFVASLKTDPDIKSLDDEYPGLFEAMRTATRDLVATAMGRSVDHIQLSVGRLIETQFTPAEVTELATFYRSPVGQKTLQQMAANADASKVYQRAVQEPDFTFSETQIAEQARENAAKAVKSFTPDEQVQMVLFMAKPSFQRLAKVQPQIRKILADNLNSSDPEFDKQVDNAMATAIEQHIAGFQKK